MKWRIVLVVVLLVALAIVVGGWSAFATADQPHTTIIGRLVPLPIVCSTRGCITSTALNQHLTVRRHFASATGQETPTFEEGLTTLARQHLVAHAELRQLVREAEARRYREEILNLTTEKQSQSLSGLDLMEYDQLVLLPFLQQEALRQQREIEELDELFRQLAAERPITPLILGVSWDTGTAQIVRD